MKPAIVGVLEDPSPSALTDAKRQLDYVLQTPSSLGRILNLMDDVMKAPRVASAHKAGSRDAS